MTSPIPTLTNPDQEMTEDTPGSDLRAILRQLTPEQKRYVRWRPWCNSNTEAAKRARVSINTVNSWRKAGTPIDEAVALLSDDGIVMAGEILHDAIVEAAEIKVAGLRSRNERMRQDVSSEILDRKLGKPTQRQEVSSLVKSLDLSSLTDLQLDRLAKGEDVISVLTSPGSG